MKIALTVKGVGLGAWLDDNYAHCGFLLLVDDVNQFVSWENPMSDTADQSSHALTTFIVEEKPDVLVTGQITDTEKEALSSQGIRVLDNRQGFVLELLDQARKQ